MSDLFTIQADIWQRFPGMRLVLVSGDGLDNARPYPDIVSGLQAAAADLAAQWSYENAQSHPRVAAWREAMRRVGVSAKKCPSSIEALARRVLTGKPVASINPLVDLYNTISLRHVVPAGAWDLDGISEGLRLGITTGGEPFTELGAQQTETVAAGEISYMDGRDVVTRHFVWRQSERGKVTEATRRFLFVSEVLPEAGESAADDIRAACVAALKQHFSIDARSAVLQAPAERW